MKVIYLIRHGQASFGQANYDQLSPLGLTQSQWLGAALQAKGLDFDRVEQGTLVRQQQTLAQALGDDYPKITNAGWNEFDHRDITQQYLMLKQMHRDEFITLGDAEKLNHFAQAVLMWANTEDSNSAYQENWLQFKQRIGLALKSTIEQTRHNALVFTSGGAISAAIGDVMQLNATQILKLNLQLVNTGITKLLVSAKGVTVSTINEYVHLEQKNNNKFITYK